MKTIFDIEQKQDSPEKMNAAEGLDSRFFVFANEINATVRKTAEAAVASVGLQLGWSNKEEHRLKQYGGAHIVSLLEVSIDAPWLLSATDQVYICIERYAPKKTVRCASYRNSAKYKPSGFRRAQLPAVACPNMILMTQPKMLLDFGQPHYFNIGGNIRARGASSKYHSGHDRAWVLLRLGIVIKHGNRVFESSKKATVQMLCVRSPADSLIRITYKI